MKKSEERQKQILKFMKETYALKGYAPTVREICSALNIKSTSTVYTDIQMLEMQGLVKKDPSKPRTVIPVDSLNTHIIAENSETVNLPVIGRVAAGTPILSQQNIEDSMPLPARFVGPGNNFILIVHGNSMIKAGINDGDYILVNEDRTASNGDIVVAMVNVDYESESTVKRYFKEGDHIRLQPENDEMDPIIVDDCTIIGKVKGVFRYFN